MIQEGDRVAVVFRAESSPARRYAGQRGYVTMTAPTMDGPILFVQLDSKPQRVDTPFKEDDLEEVPPLEE